MSNKWEYAEMDVIRTPKANEFRYTAGPVLAAALDYGNDVIFVAMGPYAGASRKYRAAQADDNIKYFVHCKNNNEVLAFRQVVQKILTVTVKPSVAVPGSICVTVYHAVTGDTVAVKDFAITSTMSDISIYTRRVMMQNDDSVVSVNTPLKFIHGHKLMTMNKQIINMLTKAEKKSVTALTNQVNGRGGVIKFVMKA
jgi:hypothetical protein